METAEGLARWTSSNPHASTSMSSGVSLPPGAGTGRSLKPPTRSGAPHSSTLMWAVEAQTTAPQRGTTEERPTTLAPVPLKTGYASACSPKFARTTSASRSVYRSAP